MLKEIREKRGLTQKELSEKSGINFRMISQYEQGVKNLDNARLITLLKLCNTLDCTLDDLIECEEIKNRLILEHLCYMNNFEKKYTK